MLHGGPRGTSVLLVTSQAIKPRITIKSETRYLVSHRGLTGQVWRDESTRHWYANVDVEQGGAVNPPMWRVDGSMRACVARMNEIADCRELAIAADLAETRDARRVLAHLGGDAALSAYDTALKLVQANDTAGIATVEGMLKAASKKRLPVAVTSTVSMGHSREEWECTIVPGFSIKINDLTYFIGQLAEYGSYNLHYFGAILGITSSTVLVSQNDTGKSANKRLKVAEFCWRNHTPVDRKAADNADTMMHI